MRQVTVRTQSRRDGERFLNTFPFRPVSRTRVGPHPPYGETRHLDLSAGGFFAARGRHVGRTGARGVFPSSRTPHRGYPNTCGTPRRQPSVGPWTALPRSFLSVIPVDWWGHRIKQWRRGVITAVHSMRAY